MINEKTKVTYAIGDVHGMYDNLINLMGKIEKDIIKKCYNPLYVTIVGLGDYIDRGPKSREVLNYIIEYIDNGKYRSHWIMGNHECMVVDSDYNDIAKNMWLHNGGHECLDSYSTPEEPEIYHPDFEKHKTFLKDLDLFYEDELAYYVHAGLTSVGTPREHYENGLENHLLWSRNQYFYDGNYNLGKPVVVGHTPVKKPVNSKNNCIMVDTGVNWSGILSACVLDSNGRIEFIQSDRIK